MGAKKLEEQETVKLTFSKPDDVDIFGGAKKKPATKSAAKDDKIEVEVSGLEAKLLSHQILKAEIADLEALLVGVTDEIKTVSKEKFIELYRQNKANPKTFLIKDGSGCIMVLPNDKYITISEERAEQLMAKYDNMVKKETKFYFTPSVLERNMKAIQNLIMQADTISRQDKQDLLTQEVKYSIEKGSIDRMLSYGEKNIEEVLADIQPIFALKNCGGGDDKKASGGFIGNTISGYSLCHYAPVFDGDSTCPYCKHECSVISEDELRNEIAQEQNEFKIGGFVGLKEYEISVGNGVYWGNYYIEDNKLVMDSCKTNDDEGQEYEVTDSAIRAMVYSKLEDEKTDEFHAHNYEEGYFQNGGIASLAERRRTKGILDTGIKRIIIQYSNVDSYSFAYNDFKAKGIDVAVALGLEYALTVKGADLLKLNKKK